MATIEQNIARITQAKADIKAAIEAKGVTVDSAATIDAYADYVDDIPTGGGGENRLNTLLKNEITSLTASDLSGVTSIKAGTFQGTFIETLSLPSTVTHIYGSAFMSCHRLKNVSIPGVIYIGSTAFSDCTALEEIDLSSVSAIEGSSFSSCQNLSSVTLSNSLQYLQQGVFQQSVFPALTIPSSVISISNYVVAPGGAIKFESSTPPSINRNSFNKPTDMVFYVPPTAVDTYKNAGGYWSGLTNYIEPYPTGITVYHYTSTDGNIVKPKWCFRAWYLSNTYDETNKGELTFSGTPTNSGVFSGITTLESIVIPEGITNIDNSAFFNCTGMTSISLPDSLTGISYAAFGRCSALSDITIPSGVTSIDSAFVYCQGLRSFTILATTPPTLSGNIFEWVNVNFPIYVPAESVEAYKAASGWSNYASRIQAIPTP